MDSKLRIATSITILCIIPSMGGTVMDGINSTCNAATLEQYIKERNDYIHSFRSTGRSDAAKAREVEAGLRTLVSKAGGTLLPQALYELAQIQRLTNQFEPAVGNYHRAATLAKQHTLPELEFDAWIGVARSHSAGTHDHGAAAVAIDQAIAVAGENPSQKQRYQIADYMSQLQAGRGELEPALLNALEAVDLALALKDDAELFYACLDTGDVLHKIAESCDYRVLVDAKTYEEEDPLGACKRAVESARTYYRKAEETAKKQGWSFMERQARDLLANLDVRFLLIQQKARSDAQLFSDATLFSAEDVASVLVNEDFSSGGSALGGTGVDLLIDQAVAGARADDPRSLYLRGIKADVSGNPLKALEFFTKSAQLLDQERESVLDLRQRGTAVENRPELIRDLGLRLLAFRQNEAAFGVFESLRSRGLEHLSRAVEASNFTASERAWYAGIVQLDSLISAKENRLVQAAIAGLEPAMTSGLLAELKSLKARRLEMQKVPEYQSVVKRLSSARPKPAGLAELRRSVEKSKIPVLLYWTTPTNVLVWVVSPKGVEVKTVFLPENCLVEKVARLRRSLSTSSTTFDMVSARQLYTYLLQPFARHLDQKQVIVVPQGALVGLPFEALIKEDGKFVAEELAVSYLPNAAFCLRALDGTRPVISKLTALYDQKLENGSHEIGKIRQIKGLTTSAHTSKGMNAEKMAGLMENVEAAHVLLHGRYNNDDPLQSTLSFDSYGGVITAAQLLATDWRKTRLAVFSSCESAVVKARISNEQFGISWALLAGGVDEVVLSRWLVNEESNALWMEFFYKGMVLEQLTPSVAANVAMRRFIQDGKSHPYYWAGPQVFGK